MKKKPRSPRALPRRSKPAAEDPADRLKRIEEENRTLRIRLESLTGSRGNLEGLSDRVLRINQLTQEFNTLDLDRIGEVAVTRIPAVVRARGCSLYLYDYGSNELVLLAQNGSTPLTERLSPKHHKSSVMGRVLQSREPICVSGFAAYEKKRGLRFDRPFADRYATETCLSLPLMTANFLVGILNLADRDGDAPFDEEGDLPVLDPVGRVLAMAIRNCKLFREVQNQAHTDALTKLGNYRAFHESLRSEMHRSARYGRPLALIMIDLDSFKELNDKFGHQAGDAALMEMGKVIRESLRREDMAARYGGDEIAILLPETKPRGALMVVQRLLAAVRGRDFAFEGKSLPVTISAGVAPFAPEMSITQFVGAADEALYRAKQAGRNRYEMAGERSAE
jgi:diguanylate cyclase (GGDEF)-like protein